MMKKLGYRSKYLVTGSCGFIGSHLIKSFTKSPRIVLEYDLLRENNIFDFDLEGAIQQSDVVFHLAALTSVDQSFKDPGKVFETNVLGTARVAYLCTKYKKKLIYPSSAAIYHRELSPYAETKALAEDIVKGIMKSTPVTILRLYNVFGSNMNPNSGSIMYRFLHDKNLIVYGDGEQTRDFIHVKDVCSIMNDAIEKSWDGKVVDIGTGQHYTMNYIAGLFAYYRKKKIQYMPPRREIKWSIADTSILRFLYKKPLYTSIKENIQELCLHR